MKLSKEVWSDIRVAAFSTIFNFFSAWLSARDWSVTASFLTLAISGTLAWYLLKPHILARMESANRKPGKRRAPPSSVQYSPIRLIAGVVAIAIGLFSGWIGIVRVQTQYVASDLSWMAEEYWKAQCLGMKAATLTGVEQFDATQFMVNLSKLHPDRQKVQLQLAFRELEQKDIIENLPMRRSTSERADMQTTQPTALGQRLCKYYLTAYNGPKTTPQAPQ